MNRKLSPIKIPPLRKIGLADNRAAGPKPGQSISLPLNRTYLVGILNVTPDSFSDGNKFYRLAQSVPHGLEMAQAGADIIDVGGESTRPGSAPLALDEELKRVIPVIENLVRAQPDILISIDTYKAKVAEEAIKSGARIINDISGLAFDPEMARVAARYKVPVILMHIKGTPRNMQLNPSYRNLKKEIFDYFRKRIAFAVKNGINRNQIIIDPGIGFGKRLEDNYKILGWIDELHKLGNPIMVGPSRKSFIGKVLNLPLQERVEGTAAVVGYAVTKGVQFVRVHDVKEMKRIITISEKIAEYA